MAQDTEQQSGGAEAHDHDTDTDTDEMQACIEECLNCHAVCTMTAQFCLTQGGKHVEVSHVGLLLDCADICQTSANFMLRGSPYHPVTCGACAELCRACVESCREFPGDEQMEQCAEQCLSCAESCERMAFEDEEEEEEE